MSEPLHASVRARIVWADLGRLGGPRMIAADSMAACGAERPRFAFRAYHAELLMKYSKKQLSPERHGDAKLAAGDFARISCGECRVLLDQAETLRPERPMRRKRKKT